MFFCYYSHFTFRDTNLADGGNNNTLNYNSSNSTFYGPLTTKGITNNTNAITNNSTLSQVRAATFSGITNNGVLYHNSSSTFSNVITAPGIVSFSTIYSGTANNFDSTVLTSPKVINGIKSGNAGGSSYSSFNVSIDFNYSAVYQPPHLHQHLQVH